MKKLTDSNRYIEKVSIEIFEDDVLASLKIRILYQND